MTFPAEAIPDGHVIAGHHLYIGALVITGAILVVMDNYRHREPLLALGGLMLMWFAFERLWPFYPGTGAALSFVGLAVVVVGVLWPGGMWSGYPLRWRVVALLGAGISLDDLASHAFGIWTPIDDGWQYIWPLLP
ncbi:hypothetical protein [Halobacterium noricense]|uniref:hypothetical protein n=1 Tax=Halobacterium noricense TaxID=223182 RepID=UPI001E5FEC56|nr:hypothetical protein [Halobacterium noricense]UHH26463.1 hypothetical protein LT974_05875 [Halobacterium noricense]